MRRMKHPNHGFHHAYNLLEEETMRKAGWVDDTPDVSAIEPESEPEVTPDRAALLETADSIGLKIDRRWSTARLAEELAKA